MLIAGLSPAWQANAADKTGSSHHSWTALAAPDTGFSDADQATGQSVVFNQNRSADSLPTQFFANNNNSTKFLPNSTDTSKSSTQTTTPTATSLFAIGGPLVDVGSSAITRIPSEGHPVVVTPEPDAFLSALLCLFSIGLVMVLSGRKRRHQAQRLT